MGARSQDLRVALIGYGLAGRTFHGQLLAAIPGMRVEAIVTADPRRRSDARREFRSAHVLMRVEDLWGHAESFDLVVVATSTPSHQSLAIGAIEAGKPVVVEKPLAPTARIARAIVDLAVARGVLVVPFHNRRWDSDHLTLQRLLGDGVLGRVLRYESRIDRWRPRRMPGSWREELPAQEGGGVLLDLGVHLVDQALSLHGQVSSVYAEVFSRRGGSDDDVFVALKHVSGVSSHLWANSLAAASGPRLRVLGTRAAYIVDDLDGQEEALRSGLRPTEPDFGVEPKRRWGRLVSGGAVQRIMPERGHWTGFYAMLERCIRGEGAPPVPVTDALAGLDIMDAARESARTGRVVHLTGFKGPHQKSRRSH
jgi:scyllo-inositol 2-dehydrogenase (NADP+)